MMVLFLQLTLQTKYLAEVCDTSLSQLGHGDYSAANTKVLRMVNTLTVDDEVKHTIEVLQNELQKARSKLQAVEDLKCQSGTDSFCNACFSK